MISARTSEDFSRKKGLVTISWQQNFVELEDQAPILPNTFFAILQEFAKISYKYV
jgi:hypothetical protein